MYSNVFIIYELSSARQYPESRDDWNQVELLPYSTESFAVLHGRTTTWFQTSRYCRAKVEFDSAINLVRHDSSTTFETGLSVA